MWYTGTTVSHTILLCGGKSRKLSHIMRLNLRGCSILNSNRRFEQNRKDSRHSKRILFCLKFFLDKRGKDSPFGRLAQLVRASVSHTEGQVFESPTAHANFTQILYLVVKLSIPSSPRRVADEGEPVLQTGCWE